MGNRSIPPQALQHGAAPASEQADNGILARVGGEYIGSGSEHLPPAGPAEKDNPMRSVVMDVPNLGQVRITYELSSYHHGRSKFWHWRAKRADQVGGAS